jgi:hypothetical protein
LPEATALHVESATALKGSFSYLHRFHAGRWRYLLKHFSEAELLGETIPTEMAWLELTGEGERRAISLAYLATLRRLPEILVAREREGAGPLSADIRQALETGLRALRASTLRSAFDSEGLRRLSAAATLEDRPFRSDVPLLGPLIARFRAAWNDVASRWYLGHLIAQQNEFNRLAVEQLASYEAEFREQMELLEEQVVITAEMQQRVQELQAQLAELDRELVRLLETKTQ